MALEFSDAGSAASAAAPSSFSFTPTQADGDLFIVHISLGDSGRTISAPSGWTAGYNSGGPEAGQQQAVFYKVVDGAEGTPFTFSWTGGGSNNACTAMRVHSTTGSVSISDFTVSETATDNQASYTTASVTASTNPVIYGIAGEGSSSPTSWSQAHGDTEIADVNSGSGTDEAAAVYHSGNLSGSISRTMTPSTADRFAAVWWIANVTEGGPAGPAISFIGSEEFNSDTDAASYTITDPLPTGLAEGDVCVLAIACPTATSGSATLSGWSLVRQVNDAGGNHRASVWYRVVEAGDTTTTDWTFDPPGTAEGIAWISSLYRGVDTAAPFLAEDAAFSDTDTNNNLASPTINNTEDTSWVISAGFGSDTATGDSTVTWTAAPTGWTASERNDIDGGETTSAHYVGVYDSNGAVATGNKSVAHDMGSTTTDVDMVSWIGILKLASGDATPAAETTTQTVTANAGKASLGALAETVTATVTVNSPTVQIKSNAQTVTVTGTTNDTAFDHAPAGAVSATAVANDTAFDYAPAEHVSATVTANQPTIQIRSNAQTVSVTATANDTAFDYAPAEHVTATGTAETVTAAVKPHAGAVTAAVVANDATVATVVETDAPAEHVSVSVTTNAGTAGVGALAGEVSGAAVSNSPSTRLTCNAGSVTAAVVANDATVSTVAQTNAPAGAVSAMAVANDPSIAITVPAGTVTATATAEQPKGGLGAPAEHVTASGTANDGAFDYAPAEAVSATVAASGPTPAVQALAGHVSVSAVANDGAFDYAPAEAVTASVVANDATVSTTAEANAPAGEVSGTAVANNGSVLLKPNAEQAAAAVQVHNATVRIGINAGTAVVFGTAEDAKGGVGPLAGAVTAGVVVDDGKAAVKPHAGTATATVTATNVTSLEVEEAQSGTATATVTVYNPLVRAIFHGGFRVRSPAPKRRWR